MATSLKVRCHCGSNNFNVSFPKASLPIHNDLCNCNTCRHTTGQLAINETRVHEDFTDLTTHSPHLTNYRTSARGERFFCSKCGAHVRFHDDTWCVSSGLLERAEGVGKLEYHIWVGDTGDGGMADHVRCINSLELPRYEEFDNSSLVPVTKQLGLPDQEESDTLQGYCHCGAIRFYVTRPSEVSFVPRAPYPDLLLPYNTTPKGQIENHEDKKWWIRPGRNGSEKKRYLAGYCACPSCRLTSGFDIQPWAFVPRANILSAGEEGPIELEGRRPSGLVQYDSSPGRHREFCGTCGATVFWWEDGRPELVDVSVGLLEGKGARAEGWLDWYRGRVSFSETAQNTELIKSLEEGLKSL